ncbi:hypothetical protein FISHEDRAFT_57437 [Fistulina hepatica ATCC 64428]|uniref:BHLH domain-containing protein n=1 Tax=Fistulina hepatica ATCC 64428 TaxID=1128425 RepID=A0A0D7AIG4_9AGAR|nr:hypothetical protein FISHEDRAFT_57437 [Fistulina hepatica ATCC 64428]
MQQDSQAVVTPGFELSYDPHRNNTFPGGLPALPPSADLFNGGADNLLTHDEAIDIFGFLDEFQSSYEFDFHFNQQQPQSDYSQQQQQQQQQFEHRPQSSLSSQRISPPYNNPHLQTAPEPSASRNGLSTRQFTRRQSSSASPEGNPPNAHATDGDSPSNGGPSRSKPPLSTPQKRLNHIMSEQKRRNAIRDGYAQLISLISPAEGEALDMPTRGRPKGSKGQPGGAGKGKSGVLFRAVEYIKWLEEGRDALLQEVLCLEQAAGIRGPS